MNKKPFKLVLCIGIITIICTFVCRFILPKSGGPKIITSATLTEAIDITELSTAEFTYRGIAEIYEDEERTRISCRVFYSAVVKAGINMKDVQFNVDPDSKTVTATLPKIGIKVNIIDEKSMAVIPADKDVGLDIMLACSKEDAEKEAKESGKLMTTARENLESTIRGLLLPILDPQGYTLIFK